MKDPTIDHATRRCGWKLTSACHVFLIYNEGLPHKIKQEDSIVPFLCCRALHFFTT